MLISKSMDDDAITADGFSVTRVMQANGITWAVAYFGWNHDHYWHGYPEQHYAENTGLIAVVGDSEEEVISEIRKWK